MEQLQKPNVFLSSALYGLEDLRSIIIELFENKMKYFVIYYGDKCSGGLTGKPGIVEQCLEGVRSSNAFVLIVDRRYGEPNQKNDDEISISLTELEFLEAVKNDISTYIFCRNEVWTVHKIWKTNLDMNFDFESRYDYPVFLMKFLDRLIEKQYYIPRFETATDLKNILDKNEFSFESLKLQPSIIGENETMEVSS